jgi:hypothetical protein
MTQVTANGNTYSDDGSTPKDMNDGGYEQWFFPMLQDSLTEVLARLTAAAGSETAAALSAAAAIAAPNTSATSTSSVINSAGTKTFIIQTGKSIVPGMWVTIARTTTPSTTWMNGAVTSYNSATGVLVVAVTRVGGSGTYNNWTITLSAPGTRDTGNSLQSTSSNYINTPVAQRYQSMAAAGAGAVYSVDENVTSIPGPDALVLHNGTGGYGHDVRVDSAVSGGSFGYMGPRKEIRLHAVNGILESAGGRPYGTDVMAKVAFSSVVAGTSGIYIKSFKLDSGNTLLLVHGASLHAVVVDSSGNFGTSTLIRATMSAAGEDATVAVAALHNGADDVLIASCPAGTTALQSMVLQISGTGLTPNSPTPTTLGSAAARIVDLLPVGVLGTGFVLATMISTTSLAVFGMLITGGTSVSVSSSPNTTTTTGSWGALLPVPGTDNVIALATTSSTVLTAKPLTLTPSNTTLTPGTSATTAITSNAGLAVRYDSTNALWMVSLTNTKASVVRLSLSGTVAAFSSQLIVQTLITTINTFAAGSTAFDLAGANLQVAVSGTDASGRFLTEMTSVSVPSGTPTVAATATGYMAAAHVPVYLMGRQWQLASATDVVYLNSDNAIDEWRMPGMATFGQALAANDPLYPKSTKARSSMRSSSRAMAVLDGTKASLQYDCVGGFAEATAGPVRFINTPLNYTSLSEENDVLWAASGSAPSLNLHIQKLRLA